MRAFAAAFATALLCALPAAGQRITNGLVTVSAVTDKGTFIGFGVRRGSTPVTTVRLSSGGLIAAARCHAAGGTPVLVFSSLHAAPATGAKLGPTDEVRVSLRKGDPYPAIAFRLTIHGFDAVRWQRAAGKQPFHFLTVSLPDAEAWHQRGWLNATPVADPFPLLLDTHVGTPEISAYHYNRTWSYTPPLSAHPLPVIGLWAPRSRRYVGLEFQTTRLADNSERDIATGYHWVPAPRDSRAASDQFVCLVYPYGGTGYQQLAFPKAGDRIASRCVLLWSLDLPATDDPNRFVYSYLWPRVGSLLPSAPAAADVAWFPGGIRLPDFEGPPAGGLIGGVEGQFQVPGTRLIGGWRWQSEDPVSVARSRGDAARLAGLQQQADELLRYARRFKDSGENCVFWEKPLEGSWTPQWGGPPVTTLHNANGFAAGRLFLGLYRELGRQDYLPIVDGVLNWAKHIAWTRNEFADVPSSPFAIGGTLSASFCLDYYMTFRRAPDQAHRRAALIALQLARSFTYRYMLLWPSDSNRIDNLDPTFLWEPNSGRDWTGAACANEVFWNLDTLAQAAVHTGDPVLMWAVQGSLSRWYLLYQERYKDNLADYGPADMTEGYGLAPGDVYGVGARASYGFASPLAMIEPVGASKVRVLAGERAALVFVKGIPPVSIGAYRYSGAGDLAFTLSGLEGPTDVSLTVPYVDISSQPVAVVRGGRTVDLTRVEGFRRPPQAPWSLYLPALRNGDMVVVGRPDLTAAALPTGGRRGATPSSVGSAGFHPTAIPLDSVPDRSWSRADSWAGLPGGILWSYGIPFRLGGPGAPAVATTPVRVAADGIALLYSDGPGPRPVVHFDDGTRRAVSAGDEAVAWRAWPPIRTARLLVASVPPGRRVARIDPNGRLLWAVTVAGSARPGTDSAAEQAHARQALQAGALAWRKEQAAEAAIAGLKTEAARLADTPIAVIPPDPAGPAINLAARAGVLKHAVTLSPGQLVDPAIFNARRFPVALYAGGELYVGTVRSPGDAAEAVERYVREGGTLLLVSLGPFPMYYATGDGAQRADPLPPRLGLPIGNALETSPPEKLTVVEAPGQAVLGGVPARFPYPPGDPRLRTVDRNRMQPDGTFTPIYSVRGASGKDYGSAAGLLSLPGGGKMLYVWGGLLRDPDYGTTITRAVLEYTVGLARR